MAGSQEEAAEGAQPPDHRGHGRCGQEAAAADDHAAEMVRGGHPQDDLNRLTVVVTAVATHRQRFVPEIRPPLLPGHVEDRLDEIFQVVGCRKSRVFLRRPEVPGRWSSNGCVCISRISVRLIVCSAKRYLVYPFCCAENSPHWIQSAENVECRMSKITEGTGLLGAEAMVAGASDPVALFDIRYSRFPCVIGCAQ